MNNKYYFPLVLITFVFIFLLKDNSLLKPFFHYITVIHELCHSLMTILTGGDVHSISLNSNGGTATTSGGIFPLISIAGYVGTTFIGSIFIYYSKNQIISNYLLKLLSLIIFIIYLFNYSIDFNIQLLFLICMNIFVFVISYFKFCNIFSLVLGITLILDSISDVRIYFLNNSIIYQTDAGILARYFGIEILAFPIAFCIFLINSFIIYKLISKLIKS